MLHCSLRSCAAPWYRRALSKAYRKTVLYDLLAGETVLDDNSYKRRRLRRAIGDLRAMLGQHSVAIHYAYAVGYGIDPSGLEKLRELLA